MNSKWTMTFFGLALCAACLPGAAQVELTRMEPAAVIPMDGGAINKPYSPPSAYRGMSTLQFRTESNVVYAIPAGQNSFSGVLVFKNPPQVATPDEDTGDRIRVRIYADKKAMLDVALDQASPPLRFNIPLSSAHTLTITSLDFFPFSSFYLAGAAFSRDAAAASASISLPEAGTGFVGFTDLAQAMFQKFIPGSTARFSAAYAGPAGPAEVTIDARSEHGRGDTVSTRIPLNLEAGSDGVATADGAWTVPGKDGPTLLKITLNVGGREVWSRTIRAALSPQIDLARVQDSTFGINASQAGYLRAPDEFAYLWNAKWARIFLRWEKVEKEEGQFDFSAMDELVHTYRAQHMKILMNIGESWPPWSGGAGPHFKEAWKNFVVQAVEHYKDKVDAWEPFNEIDNKWRRMQQQDEAWDLEALRSAIREIKQADPGKPVVCCSSSMGTELDYQDRLLQGHVLDMVDMLAIHPYQGSAPEDKEGASDFLGRIEGVRRTARRGGLDKPVWSTEAQWIMGKAGEKFVTAPDIDDHTQADYVERVNLLAMPEGKYFLFMPFFYQSHKMEHTDTLAAYSFMAPLLSDARDARLLLSGPDVFAVTARTPQGVAGALWTRVGSAIVSLTGLSDVQFFDMYGNARKWPADQLTLGQEPVFFSATSGTAAAKVLREPIGRHYLTMPPAATWAKRRSDAEIRETASGVHVKSAKDQYGYYLQSQPVTVTPGACYVVQVPIKLYRGSVMLKAMDARSRATLSVNYISLRAGDEVLPAELRFRAGDGDQATIIVATANISEPAISEFEVLDPIRIAPCRRQH